MSEDGHMGTRGLPTLGLAGVLAQQVGWLFLPRVDTGRGDSVKRAEGGWLGSVLEMPEQQLVSKCGDLCKTQISFSLKWSLFIYLVLACIFYVC